MIKGDSVISIDKVTVNIGVGASGEPLEKAEKLLEKLCNQKPIRTLSKSRIPSWGIRKKQPIGVKVTLRGKKALEFLNKAIEAKDRTLKRSQFDENGNFAFGISEYIDLPGVKYDPEIGIFGFDVCVSLKKRGYRIKRRKREKKKIPSNHKITKEEAIEWVEKNLNIKVR
ncbi:MAG: 50S ribosomal protein L5 [Candidatus Diapherotrites archaeon]|nr:50S ribosomal protein L5 [Candidatus Diapherotrites archaeon]